MLSGLYGLTDTTTSPMYVYMRDVSYLKQHTKMFGQANIYYLDYKKQENGMALIPTGSSIVGQSLYFANNPFSSFSFHVELILVGR